MENFVVSARKYRPKGFEEVVGQDHITTTLQNAIAENHLAQALLFCGPRGVGKTTCARIVARVINDAQGEENENSLNIFELDAASNNSVEHIRNLTDQVRYPPQSGNFKVYIIDEVHMLSNAAFNAFLKTLEEPPSYAIFILATTEKHKVIPTILSRCQIFDFNRIGIKEMVSHLDGIAKKEGIEAEPEALHLIAQKADGALRDALSLFDLITTFSNGKAITYADTIANLHILDYDYYFKITDQLLTQDVSGALMLFDEILRKGFDGHNFVSGLGLHFRNLLVCKDAATHDLLEEADNVKKKYIEQAGVAPESFLISAMNLSNQADTQYKASRNQRLVVELMLMKIAHLPSVLDLAELSKKKITDKPAAEKKNVEAESTPSVTPDLENTKDDGEPEAESQVSQEQKITDEAPASSKIVEAEAQTPTTSQESVLPRTKKMPSLEEMSQTFTQPKEPIEAEAGSDEPQKLSDFDQSDVDEAWQAFRELRKDKAQEYNVLNQPYSLSEDKRNITLELSNSVQLDILEDIRSDLMVFLKSSLQNDTIKIHGVVTQEESKEMLYTNKEKFEHLAEKYPAIATLQEKLGLDPDF